MYELGRKDSWVTEKWQDIEGIGNKEGNEKEARGPMAEGQEGLMGTNIKHC